MAALAVGDPRVPASIGAAVSVNKAMQHAGRVGLINPAVTLKNEPGTFLQRLNQAEPQKRFRFE
jgi:hypothetical protein